MVELAAARAEQPVERLCLRRGARIAVEDHRDVGAEFVEPFADHARDDLVRDQFARVHHRLGLEPDRLAPLDPAAHHFAGRDLHLALPFLHPPRPPSLPPPLPPHHTYFPRPLIPLFPPPPFHFFFLSLSSP